MGLIRSSSGDPIEQHDYHDLVRELLSDSDIDDLLFTVDRRDADVTIEMVDFEDFRGFNVTGLDKIERGVPMTKTSTDLFVEESDRQTGYVLFASDAPGPDEFLGDLDEVLNGLDCTRADVKTVKKRNIENLGPILSWIDDKLNITPS